MVSKKNDHGICLFPQSGACGNQEWPEACDVDRKKRGLSDWLSSRVMELCIYLSKLEQWPDPSGKTLDRGLERKGQWNITAAMVDDSRTFLVPRTEHLTWMWHFPSWMGLPHSLGSKCPRVFQLSLQENGCEHSDDLSVPRVPQAFFQSVKKLIVQCRCNALGSEGLGLGPRKKAPGPPIFYPGLCISEY